ncbi:PREDICTED: ATP synthase subunit g, mitochondrial [Dufourea novaeangliae]|uniref:ATP synthase subunit g n=1 Tax=Dufourea novaeangliae TaxID=178035 RepID=A0A154NWH6_DUFNO|nr:PREDICTED: ATP synthase subunit g, mitochondrial [Dufourea novaeangliae]KZC03902.1 ATP synthase subunit g, mitochondrial [Dufourea novaeangliae]
MAAVTKTIQLCKSAAVASKPLLQKFKYYGKVELVPPKVSDIPAIKSGIKNLINSAKTGRYREVTVREAWLNTLVTIEVVCWFFVGECIGKRHIVGYNV